MDDSGGSLQHAQWGHQSARRRCKRGVNITTHLAGSSGSQVDGGRATADEFVGLFGKVVLNIK